MGLKLILMSILGAPCFWATVAWSQVTVPPGSGLALRTARPAIRVAEIPSIVSADGKLYSPTLLTLGKIELRDLKTTDAGGPSKNYIVVNYRDHKGPGLTTDSDAHAFVDCYNKDGKAIPCAWAQRSISYTMHKTLRLAPLNPVASDCKIWGFEFDSGHKSADVSLNNSGLLPCQLPEAGLVDIVLQVDAKKLFFEDCHKSENFYPGRPTGYNAEFTYKFDLNVTAVYARTSRQNKLTKIPASLALTDNSIRVLCAITSGSD